MTCQELEYKPGLRQANSEGYNSMMSQNIHVPNPIKEISYEQLSNMVVQQTVV